MMFGVNIERIYPILDARPPHVWPHGARNWETRCSSNNVAHAGGRPLLRRGRTGVGFPCPRTIPDGSRVDPASLQPGCRDRHAHEVPSPTEPRTRIPPNARRWEWVGGCTARFHPLNCVLQLLAPRLTSLPRTDSPFNPSPGCIPSPAHPRPRSAPRPLAPHHAPTRPRCRRQRRQHHVLVVRLVQHHVARDARKPARLHRHAMRAAAHEVARSRSPRRTSRRRSRSSRSAASR